MDNPTVLSRDLVDTLCLEYQPVAFTLIREQRLKRLDRLTEVPAFCAGLNQAGRGSTLFLQGEGVRCKDGALILGLLEHVAGINADEKPTQCHVFGVVLTPLQEVDTTPDAVLFTLDPEQADKLLQAAMYAHTTDDEGRRRIPAYAMGGELLLCPANVAMRVMVDHQPYICLAGRWGHRNFLSDKLVLGIPFHLVQTAHRNIGKILSKPLTQSTTESMDEAVSLTKRE